MGEDVLHACWKSPHTAIMSVKGGCDTHSRPEPSQWWSGSTPTQIYSHGTLDLYRLIEHARFPLSCVVWCRWCRATMRRSWAAW